MSGDHHDVGVPALDEARERRRQFESGERRRPTELERVADASARRRRRWRWLVGLLVVAAVALAVVAWDRSNREMTARARCDAAIAALSPEWSDDVEPGEGMQTTLIECPSKGDWIAAAERHVHDPTPATDPAYRGGRSPIIAGSTLPVEQIWVRFCKLRPNIKGPAPACSAMTSNAASA